MTQFNLVTLNPYAFQELLIEKMYLFPSNSAADLCQGSKHTGAHAGKPMRLGIPATNRAKAHFDRQIHVNLGYRGRDRDAGI